MCPISRAPNRGPARAPPRVNLRDDGLVRTRDLALLCRRLWRDKAHGHPDVSIPARTGLPPVRQMRCGGDTFVGRRIFHRRRPLVHCAWISSTGRSVGTSANGTVRRPCCWRTSRLSNSAAIRSALAGCRSANNFRMESAGASRSPQRWFAQPLRGARRPTVCLAMPDVPAHGDAPRAFSSTGVRPRIGVLPAVRQRQPEQAHGLFVRSAQQRQSAHQQIRLADLAVLPSPRADLVRRGKHGLRRHLSEVEPDDRRRPRRHVNQRQSLGQPASAACCAGRRCRATAPRCVVGSSARACSKSARASGNAPENKWARPRL